MKAETIQIDSEYIKLQDMRGKKLRAGDVAEYDGVAVTVA